MSKIRRGAAGTLRAGADPSPEWRGGADQVIKVLFGVTGCGGRKGPGGEAVAGREWVGMVERDARLGSNRCNFRSS